MVEWVTAILTTLVLAGPVPGAELDGTLKKIKATNTITLGYRGSSAPFSFEGDDGKPAGYSVDLCTRVVADIGRELALPALQVKWVKVTVANRVQSVARGTIDLECGSTTASLSRQEQVDFSLMIFVDGGSLLVTDASGIRSLASLEGKRIALIPGTTTETGLAAALKKRGVSIIVVAVKDHAGGVATLETGKADAYASDRLILLGVSRTARHPDKLSLVDDFFSYEPYGLMLRRGDAAFRLSVNRTLAALYRSGDIEPILDKWFATMAHVTPVIRVMYLMNALPE
jgi:glutamate/aspartate transport system substrate-binding protein